MTKTLNLAKELILKKSITPVDDGCQDLLISHLESLGFSINKLPSGEVTNFYARKGNEAPKHVGQRDPGRSLGVWAHTSSERRRD